jgi:hypothetical protein
MSITDIRVRFEEDKLILQVQEQENRSGYGYSTSNWRDAKVEDMLDIAPFMRVGIVKRLECDLEAIRENFRHEHRERMVQALQGNPA